MEMGIMVSRSRKGISFDKPVQKNNRHQPRIKCPVHQGKKVLHTLPLVDHQPSKQTESMLFEPLKVSKLRIVGSFTFSPDLSMDCLEFFERETRLKSTLDNFLDNLFGSRSDSFHRK